MSLSILFFLFPFLPKHMCSGSQESQRGWWDGREWLHGAPGHHWEARPAEMYSALLQPHQLYLLSAQAGWISSTGGTAVGETQGISQAMSQGASMSQEASTSQGASKPLLTPRLSHPAGIW